MYSFAYFLALLGSCLLKEAWAQQEVLFDCAQMPGMKQGLALFNINYFSVNSTWDLKLDLTNFFNFLFFQLYVPTCAGGYTVLLATMTPRLPSHMMTQTSWDNWAMRAHRVKAGCNPSGNHCTGGPPDANSCDEYSFATTKEADQV